MTNKLNRQRNRKINSSGKTDENDDVSDNIRNEAAVQYVYDKNSWFDRLIVWDIEVTAALALCASDEAPLGRYRPLMKLLELSCHGVPWFIWTTVVLLSSQDLPLLEIMTNLFMALVVDIICITVLKTLVQRERPAHNQADMFATVSVDRYSFPSGHATRAAALGCFFLGQFKPSAASCILIILWVTAVTLSRVLLGRHHVLDVLCGVVAGMLQYPIVLYCWLSREKCVELLSVFHPTLHEQLHVHSS